MFSDVQQSVHLYIHMYLFQILFPFRLSHNIEQSSLYYTAESP